MDNKKPAYELVFEVQGVQFAAQAWGNPKHLPVMALHGWLDNSASFFALAPLLKDVFIVAVDLAGHGRTGHRKTSLPYNIWEDVPEIFTIADQLGWEKFSLLGHSRGAIISTLAAGTFPERIAHVALIEGMLPDFKSSDDTPAQLASSIEGMKAQLSKKLTLYPNLATAITARERGMFPLSHDAAKAITERGIKRVENKYQWSTDQRLMVPSAVKFLPDQMKAFINRIKCPISLVLGKQGIPELFPDFVDTVKKYPQINLSILSGGHHLHMEREVEEVAAIFNPFFASEIK
ncbi:MAG: alpha/beta fold hydrolase [Gammaproteobacteria bacterium]|nr:MAG: alpha/beta fold hydrolase [Gammaproteobacteria bacterium]